MILKIKHYIVFLALIGSCLILPRHSFGQKVDSASFKIKVLGISIGTMDVKKISSSNSQEKYELHSQVSFWFFGKIYLDHQINCVFQDGQYISSEVNSKTNRGNFLSKIHWESDQYIVDANTYEYENKQPIRYPIVDTISELYFSKPKIGDEILSETYGLTSKISEIEPDVFEITINGNKNHFYYKDDVLDKVMIENPVKNFIMQRIY